MTGVSRSDRPMLRYISARTRSATPFTISAPSSAGSICTRNNSLQLFCPQAPLMYSNDWYYITVEAQMKEKRPVLIVGAGPTGMTAALEIVGFGIPLRLVDKDSAPANTSRALAVQSRALERMQQRGLADEMVRLGNKGLFTTMYAAGKQLGQVDLRQIDRRFNYTLLLAQ